MQWHSDYKIYPRALQVSAGHIESAVPFAMNEWVTLFSFYLTNIVMIKSPISILLLAAFTNLVQVQVQFVMADNENQ